MKLFVILTALTFLSGCAATATVISCATNLEQLPEDKKVEVEYQASLLFEGLLIEKTEKITCGYEASSCAGGDWIPTWKQTSRQHLVYELSTSITAKLEVPSCSMALGSLNGLGSATEIDYKGNRTVVDVNGAKFWFYNSSLVSKDASSIYKLHLKKLKLIKISE